MAIKKGTDFLLYVDGNAVAASQTCTLDIAMDFIDTSNKDTNEWQTGLPGRRSGTLSVDGMVDLEETYNFDFLFGLIEAQTQVVVRFSTETAGEEYWQANAYLTALSASAGDNESTTYSASFNIDGVISSVTHS